MSWSWFIYTPRTAKEVLAIQDELELALERWIEDEGDDAAEEIEETCGEVGPGGRIPSVEDVVRENASFGRTVDTEILERLATCHASLAIDRVRGDAYEHPLQVGILRFLLPRLGDAIVDWGDLTLEASEQVMVKLAKASSRAFAVSSRPVAKPVRVRKERKGEVRSVRIVTAIERCAKDPDLRLDLRRLADRATPLQRNYIALLRDDGAMDDRKAAALLNVELPVLEAELEALEKGLLELLEE